MTNHRNRWARVAERIVQRRTELGLHNRADLIQVSGVSEPTVRRLEQGAPRGEPSASVKARVAFGLRWTADAIDLLLKGKQPEDLYEALERLQAGGATNGQVMELQAQIEDWEFRRRALKPADEPPSIDEITRRLDELVELVRSLERGQEMLAEGQSAGLAALEGALPRILAAVEGSPPSSRRAAQ